MTQCLSITTPVRLIQNRAITAAYCGITPDTLLSIQCVSKMQVLSVYTINELELLLITDYCNKLRTQINYHLILVLTLFLKKVNEKLTVAVFCLTDYAFKIPIPENYDSNAFPITIAKTHLKLKDLPTSYFSHSPTVMFPKLHIQTQYSRSSLQLKHCLPNWTRI